MDPYLIYFLLLTHSRQTRNWNLSGELKVRPVTCLGLLRWNSTSMRPTHDYIDWFLPKEVPRKPTVHGAIFDLLRQVEPNNPILITKRSTKRSHLWDLLSPCSSPKEVPRRPAVHGAILDLGLLRQVFGRLDGRNHPLHSQEGSQVGSVRGDHDQGEEPPQSGNQSSGSCPVGFSHVNCLGTRH